MILQLIPEVLDTVIDNGQGTTEVLKMNCSKVDPNCLGPKGVQISESYISECVHFQWELVHNALHKYL